VRDQRSREPHGGADAGADQRPDPASGERADARAQGRATQRRKDLALDAASRLADYRADRDHTVGEPFRRLHEELPHGHGELAQGLERERGADTYLGFTFARLGWLTASACEVA